MALAKSEVETLLINGKDLTDDDEATLTTNLRKMTLKQLKLLAKNLSIKLTGSTKKAEVIDRLLAMAQIGAIHGHSNLCNDGRANICISDEAKIVLKTLPPFSSVTNWSKSLSGILKDFTFMNLLVYLVYSRRDKTFDMHSLRAFKSLKAYKFFYDGFVKNVWVYECPCVNDMALRVLYFRAFVYHSLTCDSPLEVFVALNGDTGDVYSAQCVSG